MNLLNEIRNMGREFSAHEFKGGDVTLQWYPQRDTESPGHYMKSGFDATPSAVVTGFLIDSGSRQDAQDLERYRQAERTLRRDFLMSSADPGIQTGDLLKRDGDPAHNLRPLRLIVANVVDESGQGFATRLVLEERAF